MRHFAYILLGLLCTLKALGQASFQEDLKPALIVRLTEHIIWPNEGSIQQFTLGVYGADSATYETLNSQEISIKGKPFAVKRVSDYRKLRDLNALFIDQTVVSEIEEISRAIEKKSVLLISELASDEKSIMINLVYDTQNQSISFEVNKTNIIVEGFDIDPELLLLGGTEIDLRQLYREMKKSVDDMTEEVEAQKMLVKQTTTEINRLKIQVDQKTKENSQLVASNSSLYEQIENNTTQLKEVADSLAGQRRSLLSQSAEIRNQNELLLEQSSRLQAQNDLIAQRSRVLDSISSESRVQSETIKDQSETIVSNEDLIGLQTRLIYLFIGFTIVVLILSLIAWRFYRKKVSYSSQLSAANEDLRTEQKAVKEALRTLEKTQVQLVQSEKMAALGVLTAGMAHEINNPTSFIKSGMDVLKKETLKGNVDPKILDQLIPHMDLGVSRITAIVKSLNAFSRDDDEGMTECEIHSIMDDCLTILFHQYKNRIELVKKYEKEELIVHGNVSQLYQVFTNLFSNAIQAIEGTGRITIESSVAGDNIEISIADTGCGIPRKNLSRIFDPFFTTKDPGVGTGLGLSIVYKIIDDHGGSIKFESTPGNGTKVMISLKKQREEIYAADQ